MAKHNSLNELFTATANAIRSKTGSTDPIVADDFPSAIEGIEAGGGDSSIEDALIMRTVSGDYSNNRVTTVGVSVFQDCSNLTTASFPACTTISSYAFMKCTSLTTASFPACTTIGSSAFCFCSNLTTVSFPACTTIGTSAFYYCSNLTTASFPACTTIGSSAFYSGTNLTTVSFPACKNIGQRAFATCYYLTSVNFPACTVIEAYAFSSCVRLPSVSLPACTSIGTNAFYRCYSLDTVVLTGSAVPDLSQSGVFSFTKMSTTGYFYVPSSLITAYQSATNWAYFSSRFSAVEDYEGWDGTYGTPTI